MSDHRVRSSAPETKRFLHENRHEKRNKNLKNTKAMEGVRRGGGEERKAQPVAVSKTTLRTGAGVDLKAERRACVTGRLSPRVCACAAAPRLPAVRATAEKMGSAGNSKVAVRTPGKGKTPPGWDVTQEEGDVVPDVQSEGRPAVGLRISRDHGP